MKADSGSESATEMPLAGDLKVEVSAATGNGGGGGVRRQYLVAIAANLAMVSAGCVTGWSSPSLARMPLSDDEKSWAGSLVALGAALGPWAGGWAMDRLGRRTTLLWAAMPYLLGWGMLMAAEHLLWLLYASRVVLGVAIGITFTALPMYIGEISQPSVRGALGSLLQPLTAFGSLLMYVVGPYVPYMALAAVGAAFPMFFLVAFYWCAESPYHLLNRGEEKAAMRALKALRGEGEDVSNEMRDIQENINESKKNKGSFRDLVATRGNLRALYLSLGLVSLQQFAGINAISFFCEDIFKKTGSTFDSSLSQIIVGLDMAAASCITPIVVDRAGRRIMLITSAIGMSVPLIGLGVYFTLSDSGADVSSLSWLPVTCLVFYITVYSPGFGPLPWTVMAELFPTNVKSIATSLTASVCWFLGFVITKFFSDIAVALGNATPFYLFGGCCVFAAFFVFFLLPETKGRTFDEIQIILNKR